MSEVTTSAEYTEPQRQRMTVAAWVSILLGLTSYVLAALGHGWLALACALSGVPIGVAGWTFSLSPRERGGLMSLIAIALCAIGFVVSLILLLGHGFSQTHLSGRV